MYYTVSGTLTYTVVDIRKAFEGFESDLRMIARLTNTWSMDYVADVFHDIVKLAEAKYLASVSIVQRSSTGVSLKASKFVVNATGTGISSDRPGGNNWSEIAGSKLVGVLSYTDAWHALSEEKQARFQENNDFQIGWSPTDINTNFPGLSMADAQMYASNGYELKKFNYN